jgi:hypothetical protein
VLLLAQLVRGNLPCNSTIVIVGLGDLGETMTNQEVAPDKLGK